MCSRSSSELQVTQWHSSSPPITTRRNGWLCAQERSSSPVPLGRAQHGGAERGAILPGASRTGGAASPPRPHAHPRGPGGCQQRAGRMAELNRASPPHRLLRSQPRPRASSRPPPPSWGCANASRHGSGHWALPWPPAVKMGKQDPGLALLYPPLSNTGLSSGPAGRMQHLWVRWAPNAGGLCPGSQHPASSDASSIHPTSSPAQPPLRVQTPLPAASSAGKIPFPEVPREAPPAFGFTSACSRNWSHD